MVASPWSLSYFQTPGKENLMGLAWVRWPHWSNHQWLGVWRQVHMCVKLPMTAGSTEGWESVPRERGSLWSGQILWRCLPLLAFGIKLIRSCPEGSWNAQPSSSSQACELLGWNGAPVFPLSCGSRGSYEELWVIYKAAHLHLQLSPITFSLALFPLSSNQKDSLIWNPHLQTFFLAVVYLETKLSIVKAGLVTAGHGTPATIAFFCGCRSGNMFLMDAPSGIQPQLAV